MLSVSLEEMNRNWYKSLHFTSDAPVILKMASLVHTSISKLISARCFNRFYSISRLSHWKLPPYSIVTYAIGRVIQIAGHAMYHRFVGYAHHYRTCTE